MATTNSYLEEVHLGAQHPTPGTKRLSPDSPESGERPKRQRTMQVGYAAKQSEGDTDRRTRRVRVCCNCVGTICKPSAGESVGETKSSPYIVELIAGIMRANLHNERIQLSGLRAIIYPGPTAIGASRYVETVTAAMKAHSGNPLMPVEGCRGLLHWMRLDVEVLRAVALRGPLNTILDALSAHGNSSQLAYFGLEIIRILVCSSEDLGQKVLSNSMSLDMVLNIMKIQLRDVRVQQLGLSLLSWVVEEENSRKSVVELGGIALIVNAMKVHQFDDMVQCNGSATLCWLIHTSASSGPDAPVLGTAEVSIIIDTMNRNLHNPTVFGNGACVLSGALVAGLSAEDLSRVETTRLALLGMKQHKGSPKVIRNCFALIRLLTASNTTSGVVLENLTTVQQAMESYRDDAGIQTDACDVLANISTSEESREALLASGCVEAVVQCQLQHRQNVRVQQAAIWFHSQLLEENGDNTVIPFGQGLQVLGSMTAGTVLQEEPVQQS